MRLITFLSLFLSGLLEAKSDSATHIKNISALKDFKVELLYSVPKSQQGSWVAMCNDDKGRIVVSDQYGGLYRFSPPESGKQLKVADIEKVPAKISVACNSRM